MTDPHGALFPTALDFAWRALAPTDQPAIAALADACKAMDGGQALVALDAYTRLNDPGAPPHATLGAWEGSGRLIASAAVWHEQTPQEQRANLIGQVHPTQRGRGLGAFLIGWSVEQGQALLAGGPTDRARVLRLTTEALTPAAERLYQRHGFTQQFAEDVMRRDLGGPLPSAPLPPEVALETWTPGLAEQFFQAYRASFRDRPGFPGWSAEQWIDWAAGGEDFRPDISLLARHAELPIGFIVCDQDWIVQVGTLPEWRGRGLGSALVVEALRRFQAAGSAHVTLDVNVNNPGAAGVYAKLGFVGAGRRARYVRELAHDTA
jgi:mycothiol synthase